MGGRGRGRGRGKPLSFDIESLGFQNKKELPKSKEEPPPLYPPLEFKPVPLQEGEEANYLLALKQEFRGSMRESPYFIKPQSAKKDIERYSDKYQLNGQNKRQGLGWTPDWNTFPKELRIREKKPKRLKLSVKPSLSGTKLKVKGQKGDAKEAENKLKQILQAEEDGEDDDDEDDEEEEKKKKEAEGEEEEEEELYDEEDIEEGTDYALSYFDNGEDYLDADDDALEDGPVY
ncbi:DNA-directed RNA polymerase III subunit RPC7-like isoform X1 [Branchiostoma floridae]|uniref:DNA-directed RNA polymerase III subunit RPC7-like isoform X1 n=1 Tax=Branchiostoma floridae TaxID=7739 RepID=A0A9J7MHF4_BRAFL|nr:DNA-directed RNA polymerase III subunit RPC7-like isoform X1 [Branchiostoma floridae]